MIHQPERRPGEPNPAPDADAAMQPVRDAQSLGRESLAVGAGTVGGLFGAGEGGIAKGLLALVDRRKQRRDADRMP